MHLHYYGIRQQCDIEFLNHTQANSKGVKHTLPLMHKNKIFHPDTANTN